MNHISPDEVLTTPAGELGWRLLRYPPGRVDIDQVARVLGARGDFGIVRLGG